MAHRKKPQPRTQSALPPQLAAVHLHAAGIDVGAEAHDVAVREKGFRSCKRASLVHRLLTLLFSNRFGGVLSAEHRRAVGLIEHLRPLEGGARLRCKVTFADSQVLAG